MFYREIVEVETNQGISYKDITDLITNAVMKSKINEGLCNVSLPATTAAVMMNENDRFLLEDFKRFFKNLIGEERQYSHTDNAFSHMRASMLSTEKTIPIANNNLIMGRWQSVLLWEFDVQARKRQLIITVLGE